MVLVIKYAAYINVLHIVRPDELHNNRIPIIQRRMVTFSLLLFRILLLRKPQLPPFDRFAVHLIVMTARRSRRLFSSPHVPQHQKHVGDNTSDVTCPKIPSSPPRCVGAHVDVLVRNQVPFCSCLLRFS